MSKKKQLKLTKTDRMYFTDTCPHCRGCGKVPLNKELSGWYIIYNYQDGKEQVGPYNKEDVLERMTRSGGCESYNKTLIGPDGFVYSVK